MKLFVLKIIGEGDDNDLVRAKYDDYCCYTSTNGFVIRAENESTAREMARLGEPYPGLSRNEDEWWLDSEVTSCAEISAEGPTEYLLADNPTG